MNELWYETLGIKKMYTSAYHPQTNGKAERCVQEVKKAIRMINLDMDNELVEMGMNIQHRQKHVYYWNN